MMIVFLLIALTSASNVELAILSCKLQFQLPPSPNFLDTNISFLYSITISKTAVDGSANLILEQGSDPKQSYQLSMSTQNPASIKLSTVLGTDIFELCGTKCTSKTNAMDSEINVQEASEKKKKTIGDASTLANSPAPKLAHAETVLLQQQQRKHRGLRANKIVQTLRDMQAPIAPKKKIPEQAIAFQVSNGNLYNKGGAISYSSGGIVTVDGIDQWKMVVEETFPRGGVTKWLDADHMPVTEASTCARNIDETSDYFLGK